MMTARHELHTRKLLLFFFFNLSLKFKAHHIVYLQEMKSRGCSELAGNTVGANFDVEDHTHYYGL